MKKIKIAIAEDHEILRNGILFLLSDVSYIEVVIEAENGQRLLEQLEKIPADIVLMDTEMPELNGFEALKIIKERFAHLKIIILSTYSDECYVSMVMAMGAHSFLSKNASYDLFLETIDQVYKHGVYFNHLFWENNLTHLH